MPLPQILSRSIAGHTGLGRARCTSKTVPSMAKWVGTTRGGPPGGPFTAS